MKLKVNHTNIPHFTPGYLINVLTQSIQTDGPGVDLDQMRQNMASDRVYTVIYSTSKFSDKWEDSKINLFKF